MPLAFRRFDSERQDRHAGEFGVPPACNVVATAGRRLRGPEGIGRPDIGRLKAELRTGTFMRYGVANSLRHPLLSLPRISMTP